MLDGSVFLWNGAQPSSASVGRRGETYRYKISSSFKSQRLSVYRIEMPLQHAEWEKVGYKWDLTER